jgi:hypothetical protein
MTPPLKQKDNLGRKQCPHCKEWKSIDKYQKNISRRDGFQSYCKSCFKENYRLRTPQQRRAAYIHKKYGLTWEKYLSMLELQDNKCAICNRFIESMGKLNLKTAAHIDHNHQTKKINGLLCHWCNCGLGYFGDDLALIEKAKDYLFKHMKGGKQ